MADQTWDELSNEQQCVLYAAATHSVLSELLTEWEPGRDWSALIPKVPRLADAVMELHGRGLIELSHAGVSGVVPAEQVAALVRDPDNWMTDEGPMTLVELALTEAAMPVLRSSTPATMFGFRSH